MINVLLADQQRIVCEGIRHILESDKQIQVAGYAKDADEVLRMCERVKPDIVIMDNNLPGMHELDCVSGIRSAYSGIRIVILTDSKSQNHVLTALKNGTDGYILKDVQSEELILAVKIAAKGLTVIHKDVLSSITDQVQQLHAMARQPELDIALTEREMKVIQLIVEGKENREIAKSLYMSEGTVKNTVTGILRKLNLRSRIQLVVFAVQHQLVKIPQPSF